MAGNGNDGNLFSGDPFSEEERREIRRLLQKKRSLQEMARGWESIGTLGRVVRIVGIWLAATAGGIAVWKGLFGGGPP